RWKRRIGYASRLYDIIRFDHFRGLESYYAIPFGEKTARNGRWVKGPGRSFTDALNKAFPNIAFNAEDLGYMSQEVKDLLAASSWPGMKVLMFAFDPREEAQEMPEEYKENSVCYTGTHDNTTLMGWLDSLPEEIISPLKERFSTSDNHELALKIIGEGEKSNAFLMVVPIQDWLGMGKEARINTPGTASGNWQWRLESMDSLAPLPSVIRKVIGDRAQ
ncbi:MAG: 4-alpha-glucanotransferase, partial [Candidatus Ornithospirochaeta sp.]